ncbi:uncharacterized protein LOC144102395 [Amblyomma americanum]
MDPQAAVTLLIARRLSLPETAARHGEAAVSFDSDLSPVEQLHTSQRRERLQYVLQCRVNFQLATRLATHEAYEHDRNDAPAAAPRRVACARNSSRATPPLLITVGACSCLPSGSRIPRRRRQRLGGCRVRNRIHSVQCFRLVGADGTPTQVPPVSWGWEALTELVLFFGCGTSPPSALRYGGAFCCSARATAPVSRQAQALLDADGNGGEMGQQHSGLVGAVPSSRGCELRRRRTDEPPRLLRREEVVVAGTRIFWNCIIGSRMTLEYT